MSDLVKFTCNTCSRVSFDTNLYFIDRKSINCLWCTKYPKKLEKRVIKGDVV